ncbi:ABC transporter ATP-binding protein [Methylobacillus flagellatus]|uniref:Carbohydrate ABC transporter ATP-binding protein, CUT1 family n=1 Tax=Methylobacillus flagellatus (strain ATCC 51484 / DSM 6875 / VKM B-1610 / KT) TaxID=265072 RepID=Q1GYS3_METFK|nr:sn-glycerol-3-phosphate ABC transporter ATP-binding protein UgpC [Methylobacillus flagellatus]ABE50614.1 carbohydrate ABC transporter ATP-binding protein, CUT1 family [Methylobacillus flagellatus KT]
MATLSLQRLGKHFAQTRILQEIDLDIASGEFIVLVGPSGCGKSTLLRILAGLEEADEGQVILDGRSINRLPPRERNMALVFQDYALYPHKTVYDNLAFGLSIRGTPKQQIQQKVHAAAELLQLTPLLQRKPAALSGGQRQRVAIGRALVRDAQLFLFDEPLSNLDAKLRTEMRMEIKRLHQRIGKTMIYVTHDQVEAMTLADRIAVINHGRIEQLGTPAEIYQSPATTFVAGFMGSPSMNLLDLPLQWSADYRSAFVAGQSVPVNHLEIDPEQQITLGIRPEHIHIDAAALNGQAALRLNAVVELIEPLGAETIATLRLEQLTANLGQYTVQARLPGHQTVSPGQQLQIQVAHANLHWFDDGQGTRIASRPTGNTEPAA